jgi:hypothetical protein
MLTTWLGRAWCSTALRSHPRHRGDDVIDLDRYVLQPCMATGGRPVTYYDSKDPPFDLLAVFDDKYREETLPSMAAVVDGATDARLACRELARWTHARPGRVVRRRQPALRRLQSGGT